MYNLDYTNEIFCLYINGTLNALVRLNHTYLQLTLLKYVYVCNERNCGVVVDTAREPARRTDLWIS